MVVACLCTSSAAAQTDISLAQVQSAAARLEAQGQRQEAARLAAALLQRDPTDASAWVVVARIRRAAGDIDGALEAARNANAYADTNEERFAAAVELAAGNILKDRNLYAQFWLRRAAQVAPTEELQEQAIRNFRAVRAQTPWRFTFGFSVVPSSNVNNGSSEEILELFGLPFVLSGDAQALSGVEFTLTSTAFYRFDGFGDEPAVLSFGVAVQRVALSDAAKEQAPEASGSDYAFDALEVGFSQVVSNWSEASVIRVNTLVGHNRYGGEALSNYARAGLLAQWPVGAESLMIVFGSIERQYRFDDETRSAWITRANLRRVWQLGNQGHLAGLTFGLRHTSSESIEVDNRAARLEVDYRSIEPILGPFTLATLVSAEQRIYDASPYSADGREDTRGRLSVTLGVPDWNYYGFAPTLTFEASKTASNISLYDSQDVGVRIGIDSVF
jgi:hypothetical protein